MASNACIRVRGIAAIALIGLLANPTHAQELLENGSLEMGGFLPGWTVQESVAGMPDAIVDSGEIYAGRNYPEPTTGEYSFYLKAFAGNLNDYENEEVDASITQTVPVTGGANYTFSGWSNFGQNYSGAVDFLDPTSPSGEVASPTTTFLQVEFLDAGGNVLDTAATDDFYDSFEQFGDMTWRQHTLSAAAPAGAVSARVGGYGSRMLFNIDPNQSAFLDEFSFVNDAAPEAELLVNADLNRYDLRKGWRLESTGNDQIVFQAASWANNTSEGNNGVWVKAFNGGDVSVYQVVPAQAGEEYTFSAATRWETNYPGGLPETDVQTLLMMTFLDDSGMPIGTPAALDLATVRTNDGLWQTDGFSAVAPEGTAMVRVEGTAIGNVQMSGSQLSAFFDDFSLQVASDVLAGDFNNDGVVDGADYTLWRNNLGSTMALPNETETPGEVTVEDYNTWKSNFGAGSFASATLAASAVPEPAALTTIALGCGLMVCWRRRKSMAR